MDLPIHRVEEQVNHEQCTSTMATTKIETARVLTYSVVSEHYHRGYSMAAKTQLSL